MSALLSISVIVGNDNHIGVSVPLKHKGYQKPTPPYKPSRMTFYGLKENPTYSNFSRL